MTRIRMRLPFNIVALLASATLSACVTSETRHDMVSRDMAARGSDLDAKTYGLTERPGLLAAARNAQAAANPPSSPPPGQSTQPISAAAPYDLGPYQLDSGDKLRIVVFGQDTLTNNYTVDAQGQVTMPLIGAVAARGLTGPQLSGSIAARLGKGFIRDPSVSVEVETYRPFFVMGEVVFPGQYPYVPGMTVENAIAIAGGFTPRASRDSVTISRRTSQSGTRGAVPINVPIKAGDTITVAERWF
jgi:polysaccharide biosynthesis/export protein